MLQDESRALSVWLATRLDSGWRLRQNPVMKPPERSSRVYRFHQTVLAMMELMMLDDPSPDTPEGLLLQELARAVETYEKACYPLDPEPGTGA